MKNAIEIPMFCENHRTLLIYGAQFNKNDPWQALEVVSQISLFQAASAQTLTHEKTGGDINKISTLGCLACYSPDVFTQIIEIARKDKSNFIKNIKAFGESFVKPKNN